MNIIQKLLTAIFKINNREILSYTGKNKRKRHLSSGCYITIDSMADEEKNKMESELALILKNSAYEPSRLTDYMRGKGLDVYSLKYPKLMNILGEKIGFIYPQKGLKAIFLSIFFQKKISIKTGEMFIIPETGIDKYYFIYHFYNWYSFTCGVSGIDSESIELLNKYLYNASDAEIKRLSLREIYKLKDAIKQDKASIDFLLKLCKEDEGVTNAFLKIKDNGASI